MPGANYRNGSAARVDLSPVIVSVNRLNTTYSVQYYKMLCALLLS